MRCFLSRKQLLILSLSIILLLLAIGSAVAEIPSGLKNNYKYGTQDKSILPVKERLAELGFLPEDKKENAWINQTLKNAVMDFQEANGIDSDGKLDTKLFKTLFSDDAMSKSGNKDKRNSETANTLGTSRELSGVTEDTLQSQKKGIKNEYDAKSNDHSDGTIIAALFIGAMLLCGYALKNKKKKPSEHPDITIKENKSKPIPENRPYHPNGKPENEARILEIQKLKEKRLQQIKQEAAEKKRQEVQQKKQELLRKQAEAKAAAEKDKEERKLVALYSQKYQQLNDMLEKYHIVSGFRTSFRLSYVFHSRRAFEETQVQYALAYLARKNDELMAAFEKIKGNRQRINSFMNENQIITQSSPMVVKNSGLTEERFYQIEKELCKELENKVVINMEINLDLYYRSLGGSQHDSRYYVLGYVDLNKALSLKQVPEIEYTTTQEEREKMTPSLRYEILKRDGFRCVLCGATSDDGAKLHVDHIMPISKGGKTEPGNLRTLCDKCNLGKGAKYDPEGMN